MKNVWRICKINLAETFSGSTGTKKKESKSGGMGAALMFLFLEGYMLFMFYKNSFAMASELAATGEAFNVLHMAYILAFVFTLSLCIFQMGTYLFGAKDHDMLMSMPIRVWELIAGKLLPLYITNLAYSAPVMLGSYIGYGTAMGEGAAFYGLAVLVILFTPLVPMVISALIAWLMERVASLFKAKNIVRLISTTLVMVVLIVVVFIASGSSIISVSTMNSMFGGISKVLITSEFTVKALCGQPIFILWFILINLGVFAVFAALFSIDYVSVNSRRTEIKKEGNYTSSDVKASSVRSAFFKKEIGFVFSNTNYVMNGCIGIIMLTIAALAMIVFGDRIAGMLGNFNPAAAVSSAAMFLLSMSSLTPVAISLEAPYLWMLRSLPVNTKDILAQKLLAAFVIVAPITVIDVVIAAFALNAGVLDTLAAAVLMLAYSAFTVLFGFNIGLKRPKLNWTNDTVVLKQSSAVTISAIVDIVIAFAVLSLLIVCAMLDVFIYGAAACAVIFIALDIVFLRLIMTKGIKRFDDLM